VTKQIVDGADAEALLRAVAGDLEVKVFDAYAVRFDCRCTRQKVETALLGLGKDELAKIAREQPQTEATCDFCGEHYVLSADDVRGLAERASGGSA
jgi:molecular chaperone Hsp33